MIEVGEVLLDTSTDLRCHHCGGDLICTATVPHTFTRADGAQVHGRRIMGLCASCDADNPAALGVIAFFVRHEAIEHASLDEAAALIHEWLAGLSQRLTGDADDEDDVQRWRQGEY